MVSSLASSLTIFLSILVIFSLQLSQTDATYEECVTATITGNYPGPTDDELLSEIIDQCGEGSNPCTLDLTNWEEYNDFQSICTKAKGEVYEGDYTWTCSGSANSSNLQVINAKECVAPICTTEDIKTAFFQPRNNCTYSSINIVSGSSALLGEFSLRLVAVFGGIGFLMNAVI